MAYINIADWTPDQVTDWLKGLDDSLYKYSHSFTNNEVNGTRLLNIRPYELEQLGMNSIGHQEIVLEAVENLRNFHYNLKQENLQFMALHVATAARSLHRKLAKNPEVTKIETQTLNDITRTLATIKPLIGWLERTPFRKAPFNEICKNMLRYGLELATVAHRDRFVENAIEQILSTAEKLERLGNYIIQDISDPMLLQPASLNLVTFKKKEADVGFDIDSSYQGIHRIIDIKTNSPVHNSGKIEDGDEIVQINYQTVVGWQSTAVIQQLRESVPDVLLTLKKRPKHTKIYGQIYDQPYRLPSKKRVMTTRWGEKVPSPRPGFLTVPEKPTFHMAVPLKTKEKDGTEECSDSDSSCSDILTPTDTKPNEKEIRLYYRKPRTMLQRRNTICGDEFLHMKNVSGTPFWHERKVTADPASPSLRDKSVSFGFGLEMASRPTTCMGKFGAGSGGKNDVKNVFSNERKALKQLSETINESDHDIEDKSKPGVCKVVRFDANMKVEDYQINEKYSCNVQNTILETFEPILFADEEEDDALDSIHNTPNEKPEEIVEVLEKVFKNHNNNNNNTLTEAVNFPVVTRRGRLDKSHSTPAYDNSGEEECDTPPAIEPRKEFLLVSPPIPPPKPRKKDMPPLVVPPPPPKPASLKANSSLNSSYQSQNQVCNSSQPSLAPKNSFSTADKKIPPLPIDAITDAPIEINELHTPTKAKTLTLKKKHNLMAKRRNVNLKSLGTGEIQGHLYRRKKDKRGVTFWARVYFVMLDTILYGFRTKEANKASCVIFLPGFTVSLAKEVYSKPHAFKVYHSAKTFYFAAESQDALNQWVDFIKQATLQSSNHSGQSQDHHAQEINAKDLFSENESSEEESESLINTNLCTPSPQNNKDIHSILSVGGKNGSANTPITTKSDRNYFGSLKKLTKGSLPFKSSSPSEKKPSSDIPVPTEQYRSYRKVPGGSFGIQIGTNTPGYHDQNHSPLPSHQATQFLGQNQQSLPSPSVSLHSSTPPEQPEILPKKISCSPSSNSILSTSDSTSTLCLGPPSSPAPTPSVTSPNTVISTSTMNSDDSPSKSTKKLPYNFLHASNPNLVEFDFQTSKTLDYSLPKINSSNTWEVHHNIQGFVTLKDLMLKKQQEEAQEMYNNRVDHGIERKRDGHDKKSEHRKDGHKKHDSHHNTDDQHSQSNNLYNGKIPRTQLRSLPKTPDDEISFKPDDEDIKMTRTKEGLKLRDFGYELISGDEPISSTSSSTTTSNSVTNVTASRQNSNASTHSNYQGNWSSAMKTRQFLKSQLNPHKQKKHSSNSCSSTSSADFNNANNNDKQRSSSFKKKKLSSDRLFHFHKSSSGNSGTMTLPSKKSQQNLTDYNTSNSSNNSGIKKSHTYNNDLKDKANAKFDIYRKNSAPMPILSKLPFATHTSSSSNANNNSTHNSNINNVPTSSSKPLKEKKLLGSPHLHRAIFGTNHHHHQHQHHQYNQQHHQSNSSIQSSSTTTSGSPAFAGREYDQEIFAQVILPTNNSSSSARYRKQLSSTTSNNNSTETPATPLPIITLSEKTSTPNSTVATPEYPNMECPPVFQPEIYSLTDSNASLSLLLRRNNSTASSSGSGPTIANTSTAGTEMEKN